MKQFTLYEYDLSFPEELVKFNNTYKKAQKFFYDCIEYECKIIDKVDRFYTTEVKECRDFYNKFPDMIDTNLCSYINKICEFFVKLGCLNINEDKFVNDYFCEISKGKLNYLLFFEEIYDYLDKLDDHIEIKKNERKMNKNSRGRVIGGGFGLKGFAKGALTASLLNGVSGAIYSGKNAIGNIMTTGSIVIQKEKLVNNDEIKQVFLKNILQDLKNVRLAGQTCFEDYMDNAISSVYKLDREECKIIYLNLNKYPNISDEMKKRNILNVIVDNPYFFDIYSFSLERLGDETRELELLASFWGLDLFKNKEEILLSYFEFNKEIKDYETLNKLLLEKARFLGIELNKSKVYEKLNSKKIYEYTYMGKYFDNKNDLYNAKEETKKCKNIIQNINYDDLESLKNAKNRLEKCNLSFCDDNNIIKRIDDRVKELDLKSRTYMGITLNSIKEVKQAENVTKLAEKICEDTRITDWNSLQKSFVKLKKIDVRFVEKSDLYNKIIENYISKDIERRTYRNVLYKTYEIMEQAKQESKKVDAILNKLHFNSIDSIQEGINEINKIRLEEYNIKSIKYLLTNRVTELKSMELEYKGIQYETEGEREYAQKVDEILDSIKDINLDEINIAIGKIENLETTKEYGEKVGDNYKLLTKITNLHNVAMEGITRKDNFASKVQKIEKVVGFFISLVRLIATVAVLFTTYINGRATVYIFKNYDKINDLEYYTSSGGLVFYASALMAVITFITFCVFVLKIEDKLNREHLREKFLSCFSGTLNQRDILSKDVNIMINELEKLVKVLLLEKENVHKSLEMYSNKLNKKIEV